MSELPSGWAWTTVGEIAELADGPFGSNLKTAHYVETGPRVVRLQNIGDGVFRDERAHITQEHYEQLIKHAVAPGDVVVASLGDHAPRACRIPPWLGPAVVKADCIRLRPSAEIDVAYLTWMLNSPPVRRQAAQLIKGIGRPRLGLGGLRKLRIVVPPLAEQRRTVAAIEEQISRVESGTEILQQAILRANSARAAVLSHMLRSDAPSHRIAELLSVNVGGTWGMPPASPDRVDVAVFRVTEFRAGGVLDPATAVTRSVTPRELRSRELRQGDLLLEKSGGSTDRPVGRVAWVPQHEGPAVCANFVQLLRVDPTAADARYVFHWLTWLYLLGVVEKYQRATTNIRNLKTQDYLQTPIPLPELEEQRQIAADVDDGLAAIDNVKAVAVKARDRADFLRKAILASAFWGELASQHSDDESASVLLGRIAAEHGAAPQFGRKPRERTPA